MPDDMQYRPAKSPDDGLCHRPAPDDGTDCTLRFRHLGDCSWHVNSLPRRVPLETIFGKGQVTAALLENLLGKALVKNLKVTFDVQVHPDGTTVPVEITMPQGELGQTMAYEHLLDNGQMFRGVVTPEQLGRPVMCLTLKSLGGMDSAITTRFVTE